MGTLGRAVCLATWALAVACSSGSTPATEHLVDLGWAANRERGVNQPGGGYLVEIDGKPGIDVPYVSGPSAPTSLQVKLWTGSHTVAVRAYSALDAQGGTGRTVSERSQTITVRVP